MFTITMETPGCAPWAGLPGGRVRDRPKSTTSAPCAHAALQEPLLSAPRPTPGSCSAGTRAPPCCCLPAPPLLGCPRNPTFSRTTRRSPTSTTEPERRRKQRGGASTAGIREPRPPSRHCVAPEAEPGIGRGRGQRRGRGGEGCGGSTER